MKAAKAAVRRSSPRALTAPGAPAEVLAGSAAAHDDFRHAGIALLVTLALAGAAFVFGLLEVKRGTRVTTPWVYSAALGGALVAMAVGVGLRLSRTPGLGTRIVRAVACGMAAAIFVTEAFLLIDLLAGTADAFGHAEDIGLASGTLAGAVGLLFPLPRASAWWATFRSALLAAAIAFPVALLNPRVLVADFQNIRAPGGLEWGLILAAFLMVASYPFDAWRAGLLDLRRGAARGRKA